MKKLILAASIAILALPACSPPRKAPTTAKYHVAKQKVYHFSDGRVGYQDQNTMLWYWLIMNNNANNNTVSSSPTIAGGWSKGDAPSAKDVADAESQDQGVIETEAGLPVDANEAASVEAANPSIAETAPAATGEISGTVTFSAQVEGETAAPEGEGGADTATDSGASASDAGSSDSGGGGDAGGGGGDGGGGGGGE